METRLPSSPRQQGDGRRPSRRSSASYFLKEARPMKQFSTILLLAFVLLAAICFPPALAQDGAHLQHGRRSGREHDTREHSFGAKEFDSFHDILHPLQHEALPNDDFKTIRARAPALHRIGQSITKRPAPRGVTDRTAYKRALRSFAAALLRFRRDAARGTDEQLKTSYMAVHDTFEDLAGRLPGPIKRQGSSNLR